MGSNVVTNYSTSIHWTTTTAISILLLIGIVIIVNILKVKPLDLIFNFVRWVMKLIGAGVGKIERNYNRDVEIGRISENSLKVKVYKWLNDLIIDLGYKQAGVTPIELTFFIIVLSLVIDCLFSLFVLHNPIFIPFAYFFVLAAVVCVVYTKANVAHDNRISDVILAENIISNSIDRGVIVAIKDNIESMPPSLKNSFLDFIDNIEAKNYYIRDALLILGNNLGSISDDFIQKCITLELEEEAGLAGIFKDVVEVNNIKSELRIEMKRKFEQVVSNFVLGSAMIFVFLGGAIALYPVLQMFYFTTTIGQAILLMDFVLMVAEFVIITYFRAKEI